MIRESSIALAEPIAVAGFDIKPSIIIEGLNGEVAALGSFTDNFRQEIVEVTSSEDSGHTAFTKEGSDRMAAIIRTTLSNISEYGKPLAMAIARSASNCYSRDELKSLAMSSFTHSFVHLDDPFFDSPLFPKEVKEKGLNFTNVNLDVLKSLVFEDPTREQIVDFIGTNHADVAEVMRERDFSMNDAAFTLGNFESLAGMFVKGPNGNFDFSKVKSMASEKLIKVYVLLTRMYASEDIPAWFKGGELSKYREYVNLLWNGMTLYLLKLQQNVNALRARDLVLVDAHPVAFTDIRGDSKARIVKAEVTCYYTDKALNAITGADCSMSEVLLGYYWEKLQGRTHPLAELTGEPTKFQEASEKYFNYVHEKLLVHARDRFIESALKAMEEFIVGNPLVLERVQASGQLPGNWLRARFLGELERGYYTINSKNANLGGLTIDGEAGCSMEDAIMGTHIVPVFLREIGCEMAAEIIEDTFVSQAEEDNVADKKERISVAVINLIARKCFV
jgi:hypothetical protein